MTVHFTFQRIIYISVLTVTLLFLGRNTFAEESKIISRTYTYKKVGELEIKADVHRVNDNVIRPVVVSIHGGALIMGHREWINETMKRLMLESGYVIVSIDYRLAPETKLPDIIEDLEDAFAWIYNEGVELFNADINKIAVMGGSAGGYLTLTAGFRAKPRPTVLVALYGYGDLVGDWYSQPSKHPRHQKIKLTKDEVYEVVNGPPISDARDRQGNGSGYYQYCRQHGIWPKEVSGWDPHTETEEFVPYMPLHNVSKDYPPTVLIHGTHDTDVPYEQSMMMADALKKHGVEHQFITIPGAEHGLDGGDPERIKAAYRSAFEFINHHMK